MLIPYRKGDQWGFATPNKQIFIVPQHDEVYPFQGGYARVRNGTRYGVINKSGRIIVPIEYDAVSDVSEGKFVVKQGNFPASRCGYYDTLGYLVIPLRFVDAYPFRNGKAMVKIGSYPNFKNIFIDHEGKLISQLHKTIQYEAIGQESEGMIAFRDHGKWGYLNTNSQIQIPAMYEDAGDFSEGLAYVKKNGKYGYINKENKVIIPFRYDMAGNFYKEVAIVYVLQKTNDEFNSEAPRYGLINKNGKEITPLQYDFIGMFSAEYDVAVVKKNGKHTLINIKGQELFPFRYDFISDIYDGVAVVQQQSGDKILSGIIDITGREIVPLSDIKFTTFSEGLIAFQKNKKVGFMNTKGEIVIPPRYDGYIWRNFDRTLGTSEFKNGICGVIKNGKLIYINNRGDEYYED